MCMLSLSRSCIRPLMIMHLFFHMISIVYRVCISRCQEKKPVLPLSENFVSAAVSCLFLLQIPGTKWAKSPKVKVRSQYWISMRIQAMRRKTMVISRRTYKNTNVALYMLLPLINDVKYGSLEVNGMASQPEFQSLRSNIRQCEESIQLVIDNRIQFWLMVTRYAACLRNHNKWGWYNSTIRSWSRYKTLKCIGVRTLKFSY